MAAKGELNYWVANLSGQLGKSELYTKLKMLQALKRPDCITPDQPLASPKLGLRLNRGRQQLAPSTSLGQRAERSGVQPKAFPHHSLGGSTTKRRNHQDELAVAKNQQNTTGASRSDHD